MFTVDVKQHNNNNKTANMIHVPKEIKGILTEDHLHDSSNPLYTGGVSIAICWTRQLVILGVSFPFCRLYSIVDEKS